MRGVLRHACLVRRTGRIAGWRERRENRARANKDSQEERVTSYDSPYAEYCAMSNVIGFLRVKHLGSRPLWTSTEPAAVRPGPDKISRSRPARNQNREVKGDWPTRCRNSEVMF